MKTPSGLIISVEQLMLQMTEPLDPFVGLKLTQLTTRIVELSYSMGYQDAQQKASSCPTCPFKDL